MKAALTVWDGRIAPVLDVSREVLMLTIAQSRVVARSVEPIEAPTWSAKIERLLQLGVDTLVCGAVSEPLHRELTARGMRVIAFVAGEIGTVEDALLAGELTDPVFSMPGCGGRRRRLRVRGGRSLGRGHGPHR